MIESEKDIERKLTEEVKKLGGLSIKLLPSLINGLPDRMLLLPGGRIIFMELKSTGEKPRKIQIFIHKRFKTLGFPVYVGDTWEGVKSKLYEIYGQ